MTKQNQSSARFRSATEFPKTITNLNTSEADNLYQEMRDCLIFTNRSRSQLLRRNEEHKQSALRLKTDVERLQIMINQLKLEKEQLASGNRQIVTDLEREISSMAGYLDTLSAAFDSVADVDNPDKAYWGYMSFPGRFVKFLQAIKAIVMWWREDKNEDTAVTRISLPGDVTDNEDIVDDKPQMNTDPASINRSLLDK